MSQGSIAADAGDATVASPLSGFDTHKALFEGVIGPTTMARVGGAVEDVEEAGLLQRANERRDVRAVLQQSALENILKQALLLPNTEKQAHAIDQGWMIRFVDCAQTAGNELDQGVWAGLLALEMRFPGAVSKRALTFLRDMDTWELTAFIEYCAFSFTFESGWRFMFDEEMARREMWSYGRETDLTAHWISIGLLSAETDVLGAGSIRGLRIGYRERWWALHSGQAPASGSDRCCGLTYRKFSPIGQQIASVLKTKPFNGYARNLLQALSAASGLVFELVEVLDSDQKVSVNC
jgi:hypothetical protein